MTTKISNQSKTDDLAAWMRIMNALYGFSGPDFDFKRMRTLLETIADLGGPVSSIAQIAIEANRVAGSDANLKKISILIDLAYDFIREFPVSDIEASQLVVKAGCLEQNLSWLVLGGLNLRMKNDAFIWRLTSIENRWLDPMFVGLGLAGRCILDIHSFKPLSINQLQEIERLYIFDEQATSLDAIKRVCRIAGAKSEIVIQSRVPVSNDVLDNMKQQFKSVSFDSIKNPSWYLTQPKHRENYEKRSEDFDCWLEKNLVVSLKYRSSLFEYYSYYAQYVFAQTLGMYIRVCDIIQNEPNAKCLFVNGRTYLSVQDWAINTTLNANKASSKMLLFANNDRGSVLKRMDLDIIQQEVINPNKSDTAIEPNFRTPFPPTRQKTYPLQIKKSDSSGVASVIVLHPSEERYREIAVNLTSASNANIVAIASLAPLDARLRKRFDPVQCISLTTRHKHKNATILLHPQKDDHLLPYEFKDIAAKMEFSAFSCLKTLEKFEKLISQKSVKRVYFVPERGAQMKALVALCNEKGIRTINIEASLLGNEPELGRFLSDTHAVIDPIQKRILSRFHNVDEQHITVMGSPFGPYEKKPKPKKAKTLQTNEIKLLVCTATDSLYANKSLVETAAKSLAKFTSGDINYLMVIRPHPFEPASHKKIYEAAACKHIPKEFMSISNAKDIVEDLKCANFVLSRYSTTLMDAREHGVIPIVLNVLNEKFPINFHELDFCLGAKNDTELSKLITPTNLSRILDLDQAYAKQNQYLHIDPVSVLCQL